MSFKGLIRAALVVGPIVGLFKHLIVPLCSTAICGWTMWVILGGQSAQRPLAAGETRNGNLASKQCAVELGICIASSQFSLSAALALHHLARPSTLSSLLVLFCLLVVRRLRSTCDRPWTPAPRRWMPGSLHSRPVARRAWKGRRRH